MDPLLGEADRRVLVDFGKRVFAMKHPALSQVEAYWEGLRGTRSAPLRSEVDPRGIDRALENAFILERIAPGVARFRLAGMHLNDLMGMEVRGMPITSFFSPDARRTIGDALGHVFEEPAKAEFDLVGADGAGRSKLKGRMILLPLRSDLGDVSRALGCLVSEGASGRAPHRFDIARTEIIPLAAGRVVAAQSYESGESVRPMAGDFAEGRPAYENQPAAQAAGSKGARHGHLRLVADNDKKS
jgi:hypothetical protein